MKKLVIIGIVFLLASCGFNPDDSEKPVVSVSILPQKYFVDRIAGNLLEVNVLIPEGGSPATYEPTIAQMTRLEKSSIYFKIGHIGFEKSWMNKIEAVNPSMKIVDLSSGIELISEEEHEEHEHLHGHAHGGIDPHLWLSTINARLISKTIYLELALLLPGEDESLKANYNQLEKELEILHHKLTAKLENITDRNFMIYHPALSYFARDFKLQQFPLEIGGKEPSPAHMKWMSDLGREKNITTIFLQDQFDQKNAEALAAEIDAEIIRINPLDPDWYNQMLYIADMLIR
jgi:zinc transport system substrate-binding protein